MRKLILLAGVLATSAAHAQQYGSWWVDQINDKTGYFAISINQTGGILGKTCSTTGCRWIMTISAKCEAGALYPALLSADRGAAHVTLQCAPNEKTPGRYIIQDFDAVEKAVEQGERVGIAIPLASGDFRVSRYDITGWTQASTQLAGRMSVMLHQPQSGEKTL